jgi:hypothetical protein
MATEKQGRRKMIRARCACVVIAGLILPALQGSCLAEPDIPERLKFLYETAKRACEVAFGENHVISGEKNTPKYYCQRLQHPYEFMQDQGWWKAHLPANVQAAPRQPVHSPVERWWADTEQAWWLQHERAYESQDTLNCKANGGSDDFCVTCTVNKERAKRGDDLPIDPRCRPLSYSRQEYTHFQTCKINGGTDGTCEACVAFSDSSTCRSYLKPREFVLHHHNVDPRKLVLPHHAPLPLTPELQRMIKEHAGASQQ